MRLWDAPDVDDTVVLVLVNDDNIVGIGGYGFIVLVEVAFVRYVRIIVLLDVLVVDVELLY